MNVSFAIKAILCCVLIGGYPWTLTAQEQILYHPTQIIVKLVDEAERSLPQSPWNAPQAEALLRRNGVLAVEKVFPQHGPPSVSGQVDLSSIYRLTLQEGARPDQVVREFQRLAVVEYAERKVIHELFYLPNDPLADTSLTNGQWYLDQVSAYEAWDLQQGADSIVIAVIDAGQTRHPDLYPNIAFNTNDPIDGVDNDGDGYLDNFEGWDLSGSSVGSIGDNDPFVGDAHGLWVAGVSSASYDNGIGLAGVSGKCRLLPVKAAPDDSLGYIFEGYEAIVYAVDQGAQIINCSWGSPGMSKFGKDVIEYATITRSRAVIAAAGNSQSQAKFYPAAFDLTISVASSSFEDTLFTGANGLNGTTYDQTVDITAPGFLISTTRKGAGYGSFFTGTSFAAPIVAGAVANTLAAMDSLTPFQAAQRVRLTSDRIDSLNPQGYKDLMGLGRVNMLKALTDPRKPSIRKLSYTATNQNGFTTLLPGDTVTVNLTWINDLHPSTEELALTAELSLLNTVFITQLSGSHTPGRIQMNEQFSDELIRFVVSDYTPEDYVLTFRLAYQDSSVAYRDVDFLSIRVNPTWISTDVNALKTTITSLGSLGYSDFPDNQQGESIRYDGGTERIYEAGILFSSSLTQVSDGIRTLNTRDKDFVSLTSVYIDPSDTRADQVVKSVFSDAGTLLPIGLTVQQEVFGWSRIKRRQFLILQYIIENNSQTDISGLYTSMFMDWDLTNGLLNLNGANYDAQNRFAFTEDLTSGTDLHHGLAVLSADGFGTFASTSASPFVFDTGGKAMAMRSALSPSTGVAGYPSGADVFQFVNTGPFPLAPGEKDTVAYVLTAVEESQTDALLQEAQNAWECDILDRGPNELFSVSDLRPMAGEIIQFQDQNTGQLTWNWEFGDGTISTIGDPQHLYATPGVYLVRLTVSDGYCTQYHAREIQVRMRTSLSEEVTGDLVIFPNPTDQVFRFVLPQSGSMDLAISDMAGRVVYRQTGPVAAAEEIEVSPDLSPGVYHLVVTQGTVRWNELLLIQD